MRVLQLQYEDSSGIEATLVVNDADAAAVVERLRALDPHGIFRIRNVVVDDLQSVVDMVRESTEEWES